VVPDITVVNPDREVAPGMSGIVVEPETITLPAPAAGGEARGIVVAWDTITSVVPEITVVSPETRGAPAVIGRVAEAGTTSWDDPEMTTVLATGGDPPPVTGAEAGPALSVGELGTGAGATVCEGAGCVAVGWVFVGGD